MMYSECRDYLTRRFFLYLFIDTRILIVKTVIFTLIPRVLRANKSYNERIVKLFNSILNRSPIFYQKG